ncbi:formate/nitrite transporter [Methanococcus maripaludis]|uniref:Formate/nitrite transporter n=1 Tax=Methanococcus maripaludis TaxID=39152 RepID=A0A7J9PRX1_METMI|nr:formate/nitrite transporter family protein [Methanococcus maripaludis]MBA2839916.1 formate/nitrite transporter [Methanococcus maripaludis]MBA2852493.1 formate/nitrite transporter [Methanococcus maripaludis]MBA2859634.1 formate/nitrite transporter [Methanococcus maripaludis]MBA2868271.1 formate/nitrite transporter [Methanococcus maripaludis]MBB6401155.1 formate/nitrite transporter [Methanococcus maripaludis]
MDINPPDKMVELAGNAGQVKGNLSPSQLLVRGVMGGAYIAMGGGLATVVGTGIGAAMGAGLGKFMAAAVFPVGLILIILTGMELVTGDMMLLPVAVFQKKASYAQLIKVWIYVYIGNLIGSLIYASMMAFGPLRSFDSATGAASVNAFGQSAINTAQAKVLPYMAAGSMGWLAALVKGIGCNWLVNLAVIGSMASTSVLGKFFMIWFPIMAFVATGFEHCVANMYFIPTGMMLGATVTVADWWIWNIIPVTIGNIIGAVVFVSMIYQFAYGKKI